MLKQESVNAITIHTKHVSSIEIESDSTAVENQDILSSDDSDSLEIKSNNSESLIVREITRCENRTKVHVSSLILQWKHKFNISDVAVDFFLKYMISKMLGQSFQSSSIPKNFHDVITCVENEYRNNVNLPRTNNLYYETKVLCGKCTEIYDVKDAIRLKSCNYVKFPNHRTRKYRNSCGNSLWRTKRLTSTSKITPLKEFCFTPIMLHIREFLNDSINIDYIRSCKTRILNDSLDLYDITDGKVLKSFKEKLLAESENTLSIFFACNIDWFSPFVKK